jgi:hypothetical protein
MQMKIYAFSKRYIEIFKAFRHYKNKRQISNLHYMGPMCNPGLPNGQTGVGHSQTKFLVTKIQRKTGWGLAAHTAKSGEL